MNLDSGADEKSDWRQALVGVVVGLVAGGTVVFAAAADLASGPTENQARLLWILFALGIILAIVTFFAVERIQVANYSLKRRLRGLERAVEDGQQRVRERYALTRASRRMRRTVTVAVSSLRHNFSAHHLPYRFGVWTDDAGVWLLPPAEDDDFSSLTTRPDWLKPSKSALPMLTQESGCLVGELCGVLNSRSSSTFYFAVQLALPEGGEEDAISRQRAVRSALQQIVGEVVASEAFLEEVAEAARVCQSDAYLID